MPIGSSYQESLDSALRRFERKGGENAARESLSRFIDGLLIYAFLGRDLAVWRPSYRVHRDAAAPSHSSLVVPHFFLLRAMAGSMLGEPTDSLVAAGWNSLEAAWNDTEDEQQRQSVSSAALGLALARRDTAAYESWRGVRQRYAPTDAMADVELQVAGRGVEAAPDLIALLGQDNVSMFSEARATALSALNAHANALDRPLASLLFQGRTEIDRDYWPEDPEGPPRADFEDLAWSLSSTAVEVRLCIEGSGGLLAHPAPVLRPILDIAQPLEVLLSGVTPISEVKGAGSRARLGNALRSPEVPLRVIIDLRGDIDLAEADIERTRLRFQTSVESMQRRYVDFEGGVELQVAERRLN